MKWALADSQAALALTTAPFSSWQLIFSPVTNVPTLPLPSGFSGACLQSLLREWRIRDIPDSSPTKVRRPMHSPRHSDTTDDAHDAREVRGLSPRLLCNRAGIGNRAPTRFAQRESGIGFGSRRSRLVRSRRSSNHLFHFFRRSVADENGCPAKALLDDF